jgi:hypothetical protein
MMLYVLSPLSLGVIELFGEEELQYEYNQSNNDFFFIVLFYLSIQYNNFRKKITKTNLLESLKQVFL